MHRARRRARPASHGPAMASHQADSSRWRRARRWLSWACSSAGSTHENRYAFVGGAGDKAGSSAGAGTSPRALPGRPATGPTARAAVLRLGFDHRVPATTRAAAAGGWPCRRAAWRRATSCWIRGVAISIQHRVVHHQEPQVAVWRQPDQHAGVQRPGGHVTPSAWRVAIHCRAAASGSGSCDGSSTPGRLSRAVLSCQSCWPSQRRRTCSVSAASAPPGCWPAERPVQGAFQQHRFGGQVELPDWGRPAAPPRCRIGRRCMDGRRALMDALMDALMGGPPRTRRALRMGWAAGSLTAACRRFGVVGAMQDRRFHQAASAAAAAAGGPSAPGAHPARAASCPCGPRPGPSRRCPAARPDAG